MKSVYVSDNLGKYSQSFRLAFLIVVLCPLTTPAQTWRWSFEDVDTSAEQTSIVADKDGNLHLAYYVSDAFGELRYAFRSASDSQWYKMTVDQHLGVFSTGISLDANEDPGICYTPRRMQYAHLTNHKWSIQEVDPSSGLIAYRCSIKYTPDDRPQLSWYLESIFVLRYAALEDATWKARSVEVGTQSGKWNSLVLDRNALPHLAYSSFKGGELHYAHFDGTKWDRTVLDSPAPGEGQRGMGASLVLDQNGNPRISYHDLQSLKYATFDGKKWTKETIEELPAYIDWSWRIFRTTQLLDSRGNPHISYESYLGLKHAWWDGKRWHTQMIKPSIGISFFDSYLTIDRQDNLYISYRDPSDGTLKIAIGKVLASPQTEAASVKR